MLYLIYVLAFPLEQLQTDSEVVMRSFECKSKGRRLRFPTAAIPDSPRQFVEICLVFTEYIKNRQTEGQWKCCLHNLDE